MNTARNTAWQCMEDKINQANTIAENTINDIQFAMQNVTGAAQLMAQCSTHTVQLPSMAGLVAKVACLGQVSRINDMSCN